MVGKNKGAPMNRVFFCVALVLAAGLNPLPAQEKGKGEWIDLFNGKDTAGWKLKSDKYTITKFVDDKGQVIPGAKETKLDQVLTR